MDAFRYSFYVYIIVQIENENIIGVFLFKFSYNRKKASVWVRKTADQELFVPHLRQNLKLLGNPKISELKFPLAFF